MYNLERTKFEQAVLLLLLVNTLTTTCILLFK